MTASATGATGGAADFVSTMRATMATPAGAGTPVSFSGTSGAFIAILARGVLMQLVTFGFYRFWLITDIRRHLWSNTRIGGESFEYTGTAKELFIGFLIALAILVPIYVVYFIAGAVAEAFQAFASVPLFLVLYALAYYAAFRARRYRATRTLFRGVRFWMTGSGWGYLGRAMIWDAATVLSLGLAYPWRAAALERYLMQNTRFGTLTGDFVGTGWELFKKLASVWILVVAVAACFAAFTFGANAYSGGFGSTPARSLLIGLGAAVPIAIGYTIAITMRWRLDGIRIGDVALESGLPASSVMKYAFFFMLSLVVLGGIAFVVGAGALASGAFGTAMNPSPLLVVGIGLFYIVILLIFGALKRFFIDRGLWRASATTLVVHNLDSIDAALAAGAPAGSLGEGLADALDMGF